MNRILLIGAGPLPEAHRVCVDDQTLRTWQMARLLLESPHDVQLLALTDDFQPGAAANAPSETLEYEGFRYALAAASDGREAARAVGEAIRGFQPQCLIAVGHRASSVASLLSSPLPLWCDLPDSLMAQAQLDARRLNADSPLEEAWPREAQILARADKFSAASMPQLHALLGELAMGGRLNRLTADYHFAHHIPDAVHGFFTKMPPAASVEAPLRLDTVPGDAFLAVMAGAFAQSTDWETLAEALEKAMALNESIHFVHAGGAAGQGAEAAFQRFVAQVEAGPFAARHHWLGWTAQGRLAQIYRECNLGLCVDGMAYETLLGTRPAVLNMLAAGLPVAMTLGVELSHVLREEDIGLVAPANDADALAQLLLDAAGQEEALRGMGRKAQQFVTRQFAATRLCRPVREWVDDPQPAPDNREKRRQGGAPLNTVQQLLSEPLKKAKSRTPANVSARPGLFQKATRAAISLMRRK